MTGLVADVGGFEAIDGNLLGRDSSCMVRHGGFLITKELVGQGGKGMPGGYRWWQLVTDRHSDEQGVELPHAIAARGDEARGLESVCRVLDHDRQTTHGECQGQHTIGTLERVELTGTHEAEVDGSRDWKVPPQLGDGFPTGI